MSKAQARRARDAFDAMIADREDEKHRARPVVAPHGPLVPVLMVIVQNPLQALHDAADARMSADPDVAATDRLLAAELAAILGAGANANSGVRSAGLVEPDMELLRHGFLEPVPTND
ncbi:hypothetical protein [Paraburkholderia haematera]|uniref:Uncharacterized protein n=1 Tax=Paraburkholderia haematera TaxID=2793077 RepID=A0ABM8QT75_9BURK|nr:hypothetical protein [Paraburkholderia haematera]CAE6713920.1 hypothetical protein R69888_01280 [Paraburkholderia haematera]